jgi:hypothetical protein
MGATSVYRPLNFRALPDTVPESTNSHVSNQQRNGTNERSAGFARLPLGESRKGTPRTPIRACRRRRLLGAHAAVKAASNVARNNPRVNLSRRYCPDRGRKVARTAIW